MIAAVLCLLMTMALAAVTVHAAEPVSYLDPADPTADTKVEDYTVLTEEVLAERGYVLETGWYLVSGEVTAEERIIIDGKVDLLLEDESYLKALQGIQVASGKVMVDGEEKTVTDELTIWAQREGSSMGALKAGTGDNIFIAPIGGGEKSGLETTRADAGVITIKGGRIEASTDTTRSFATCIGGGYINVYDEERGVFYFMGGNAGKITINGGVVTAINGAYSGTGVGIGGAKDR